MFSALRGLKPEQAAGVLGSTALKLDRHSEKINLPFVDDQDGIEAAVLQEARELLHLSPDDFSARAIEQITDVLDAQTDNILLKDHAPDTERLSAAGVLPSDVYNVVFVENLVNDFAWRWQLEQSLARETIKSPHRQQHLGVNEQQFPALTIYGRFFEHKYPARSFWMLVIGSRANLTFTVSQVWRAYPSEIDLKDTNNLLDVVKLIAENFGHTVELNGISGKFFWKVPEESANEVASKLQMRASRTDTVTMTFFSYKNSLGSAAALVIPINLTRYFAYVQKWHGWEHGVIDNLNIRNYGHFGAVGTL